MSDKPIITTYDYTHVPTIERFSRSRKKVKALMGPFGSGKSVGCVMEIIRISMEQKKGPDGLRRSRWAVVRNTYPQLKSTTMRTFFDWVPPQYYGKYHEQSHVYTITGFPECVIEIRFMALDKPKQLSKLLSLELTGGWINEAREVPLEVFMGVLGRTGRYPSEAKGGSTWNGVIMDTNPPDDDHWFYEYFEVLRPENAELFKQPSGRGPKAENLANLKPDYYATVHNPFDENFNRVHIDGEYGFIQDGKPVHPNYRDHIHTATEPLEPADGIPILAGFDFGLTPAAVLCQYMPNGQLRVLDEVTSESMGIIRFSEELLRPLLMSKYHGFPVSGWGDPAGVRRSDTDESTCFQHLHAQGFDVNPAPSNSLASRISAVDHLLSLRIGDEPALLVSPTCKMLRRGFNGRYRYKRVEVSGLRFTDKPEKNEFSHIQDAFQYIALGVSGGVTGSTGVFRQRPRGIVKPSRGWRGMTS